MKQRIVKAAYIPMATLLAAGCLFFSSGISPAQQADAESQECLDCHGSIEELAEATKDYVSKWDEHVNPHIYVDITQGDPHRGAKVIVNCLRCHDSHSVPPEDNMQVRKADLQYCYSGSCHHTESFESCSAPGCHDE